MAPNSYHSISGGRLLPALLALLAFVILLTLTGQAQAGTNEPTWSKDTDKDVLSVALSSDGQYLASGSDNGQIYLYDMDDTGSPLIDFQTTNREKIQQVALSANGRYLVAGAFDQHVYLFDRDNILPNAPVMSYDAGRNISTVDITPDGTKFIAASADGTNYLYFFDNGDQTPYRSEGITYEAEQIAISADGSAAVLGMWDNIRYYTTDEGDSGYEWYKSYGSDAHYSMRDVDIRTDGAYVVGALTDGTLFLYDENGNLSWNGRSNGEQNDFISVDMTPTGNHIVAGDEVGWVYLYDGDGNLLFNHRMDDSSDSWDVYDVAISDDGKHFVAASRDDHIYNFYPDEADGVYWNYKSSMNKDFFAAAISSDGEWSAAGSGDDLVYYFDAEGVPNEPPTASIVEIDPLPAALVGETVTFEGDGDDDGTITEYEWSSNIDGIISDQKTFSLDDLSQGDHTISLRVKDDSGVWSDPVTQELGIHTVPTANIDDIDPSPGNEGEDVTFEGSGDDDGSISRYIWSSDIQGELYNGSSDSFTDDSLSLDRHLITLIVWDNYDAASTEVSEYLTIREPPNEKPVAVIDYFDPSSPMDGDQVELKGHGTDEDGSIDDYLWRSSRDGTLGNSAKIHYELSEGVHTIYFKVMDDDEEWSDEVSDTIVVIEKLTAVLTIQPSSGEVGDTFSFQGGDSIGAVYEYLFDFGDGTTPVWDTTKFQTHVYEEAGTYEVTLLVRDDLGRESAEEDSRTLKVKEAEEDPGTTGTGGGDDGPAPGLLLVGLALLIPAFTWRKRRQ